MSTFNMDAHQRVLKLTEEQLVTSFTGVADDATSLLRLIKWNPCMVRSQLWEFDFVALQSDLVAGGIITEYHMEEILDRAQKHGFTRDNLDHALREAFWRYCHLYFYASKVTGKPLDADWSLHLRDILPVSPHSPEEFADWLKQKLANDELGLLNVIEFAEYFNVNLGSELKTLCRIGLSIEDGKVVPLRVQRAATVLTH